MNKKTSNEEQLAFSVIAQAISDFKSGHQLMRDECYHFLTGKTDISRFWFHTINREPLDMTIYELETLVGCIA